MLFFKLDKNYLFFQRHMCSNVQLLIFILRQLNLKLGFTWVGNFSVKFSVSIT